MSKITNRLINIMRFILLFLPLLSYTQHLEIESDTLILQTKKTEGYGLFENTGHWALNVEEISNNSEWRNLIPNGIESPKLAFEYIDWMVFTYKNIADNNPEGLSKFISENHPSSIDTSNIPSWKENTIKIVLGKIGKSSVYILDANANNDFRDDTIRELGDINNEISKQDFVKCHYKRYNGHKIVADSSWISIGLNKNMNSRISVANHLIANFKTNHQNYEIQLVNYLPFLRFGFESPLLSITSINGTRKDSLLLSEKYETGEYLELGDSYYKFDHVSKDGKFVALVKVRDVSGLVGTQVGFIAPNFQGKTITDDSVKLSDYKGKELLIVNITACYSPKMSYEYYKELSEKHLDDLEILAIDESPHVLQQNIDSLKLKGKFIISKGNRSLKTTYREDFCSRVCYLIDKHGRISKKFEISEWEKNL